MNRKTFIKKLAERSGKSITETEHFMFELESLMLDTLLERDSISFMGLFKIEPKVIKGRVRKLRGREIENKTRLGIRLGVYPSLVERLREQNVGK